MAWLRLTLEVAAEHVEAATKFLEQFNAGSISYRPLSSETLYADVGDEPKLWSRTSVTALVDAGIDMDILLVCLRNRLGAENIYSQKIDLLEDRDWMESFRRDIAPQIFADRLCICPSWLTAYPGYEQKVILDPGLAFGSGSHATTQLCLDWLARSEVNNLTVIDYGCGSGVLALAAARLGARHVYAVDIDPQALEAARVNTAVNGLESQVTILAPGSDPLPQAEILIANILLKPLMELSSLFNTLVAGHGQIVLSGILATQVQECLETYGHWFMMGETRYRDEWALVYGSR